MNLKNSASGDYGVRLNQPAMMVQTRCRWFIGDVTEVLDQNTWKLGKIAKMLKNNYFVIRLADCIQLKEFHITSLRVPLQDDPPTAAPYGKQFPASDKAARRGKQLPADLLGRSSGNKKRKSAAALDSPQPVQRRRLISHAHKTAAAMADHHPLQQRYLQVRDEAEAECSVASCSADSVAAAEELRFGNGCCSVGRGDAMSAAAGAGLPCASSGSTEDDGVLSDGSQDASGGSGGGVDVHELELEAYRSTVRALHASGPLTWEQESLLTNLRLSLNISNEEHLLQLRRLLSS
ncbi:uncharacterized protein LOC100837427 [Brachypodium distachyon]|uniref:ENT domain-containing protein n=1 Tax=Brachypodium distachyon TaxID=15368 RepID=A0A0Q3JKN5_BRADI|nr:uncharacterized protein LOC100837427 [Brachypodium distachyon]XP_014755169.1 uncharacterized protein LOC100837427 [Brachypodium distachyon]XP_014755171.1 uncharacterized protein LOC100837427 [Brachypodium distachyon]KQK12708.1 hypothetical protein BRADI_1g05520v3 [Brachypodium distachyon]KQK12709.1 hypothetical protein BRADI_1g05520v3 [Brachypodium distachyon]KQK12710.1 hypothetical protein BRADI_1g05520v3 [Brachypodium distachyon]PNT73973.1 hypothetical protein BRADI_1g05520v3 [Brachypodi|eukprot:XP_010228418.1 uncharacterized protein LOC100837427 [Brachypodium distachyon]